ncbi:MAG TPA: carbohydrate binding domain-containing protein, partial [Defluviitoga sp.]|nr:carbohydrate binding domain-containing protein [Defluviitoga sp.]
MFKSKLIKKDVYISLLCFFFLILLTNTIFCNLDQNINLLGNGSFTTELSQNQPDESGYLDSGGSWSLFLNHGEGLAEALTVDGALKVIVTDHGPNQWSVQLLQAPVKIERGGKYKITFDAKAEGMQSLM